MTTLTRRGRRRRGGRRRHYRGCGRDFERRIDQASQYPAVQAVGGLGIDGVGVQDKAAERRLDMAARAAKTVVEIEVPEGGIEIVAPEQADHPPAEPHAFRIAGRSVNRMLRLGIFVDLLGFLGGVRAGRRLLEAGLGLLLCATAGWMKGLTGTTSQAARHNPPTTVFTRWNMVPLDCWAKLSR